ncbi:ribbon-helix-helix protein, CopG family [Candidatus Gottesmanbacteria bacterium]|nr:ribbon-helix-helix protein, CopG family [Candidatus Gottesmanbacteria bacterium]
MQSIPPLSQNDKTVRTQISLTQTLKRLLEEKAILKGQSLSEYLRRAAMVSLILEEQDKQKLKNLANQVIGSVNLANHKEWATVKNLNSWIKNLRSEWN